MMIMIVVIIISSTGKIITSDAYALTSLVTFQMTTVYTHPSSLASRKIASRSHRHSRFQNTRTNRLYLDTTSTSASLSQENQPLSHAHELHTNEVPITPARQQEALPQIVAATVPIVAGTSAGLAHTNGSAIQTNTIANIYNNNNNNIKNVNLSNNFGGVIRWKDVLRSTHPISCDLDDEECLKRQQLVYDKYDDVIVDDIELELSFNDKKNIAVAILATIGTIATMIQQSGPGAYRYYLAGAICATASHVIPVPIDTVKTRKQVDPKFAKLSFVAAFVKIWNQEGMQGLLAGLGPTAIGYALEGGIKFGVYEAMKPIVKTGLYHVAMVSSYLSFLQSRIVSFAICAAISGVAASVVLCPMEALRIRMVANPTNAQQKSGGWFHTAIQMIKMEGITSFVKGMEPMIYKQVPYTITKNVAFDLMTRYVYTTLQTTWQITTIGPITKFVVPFAAAAAASILSCLSSQPGDVLLSLVNAQQRDIRRTRDIIRDVLHSEKGWKGFYIGTKARLLHVGIVVTLQLLIYDMVKRLCGIAATGIAK
jgi:solute carrier family 25 (mitochondrial phosphate transporter), member 3